MINGKWSQSWLRYWRFILLDIVLLQLSFFAAYTLRHEAVHFYATTSYRREAIILLISQILVGYMFRSTYEEIYQRGYFKEFVCAFKNALLVMMYTLAILFLGKITANYSRLVLALTGLFFFLSSYIGRVSAKSLLRLNPSDRNVRSLLIVTTMDKVRDIVPEIFKDKVREYRIPGICVIGSGGGAGSGNASGDGAESGNDLSSANAAGSGNLTEINTEKINTETKDIPIIYGMDRMLGYCCLEWVDEVLFMPPSDDDMRKIQEEMIDQLAIMGITTHVPVTGRNNTGAGQYIERLGGYTVLTTDIETADERQIFLKRVMDIIGGMTGIILTFFLTLFIGPAICIKSPGPIFFSQTRIGRNGRKFKMYKFRSMYPDAEERKQELMENNRMSGHMFKLDYDPRIIGGEKVGKDGRQKGIGHFIRATSIDEFPQFWNVLKGDMSLVGTRPPTVDEWEKYELHHRARMAFRPGITGLWQVSGRSNITDFEEVVKLDTEYIRNWNLGKDIKILGLTIIKMFRKDGAM